MTITVGLFLIVLLNSVSVKYFGESEVVTASIKVITFLGLIILGIVLDLGGGPNHDRLGFRYWKDPGLFAPFPNVTPGALSNFLAFFSAFVNASFTYIGTECVVLAAGEAANPTKAIPKATRRVLWRIVMFCGFSSFRRPSLGFKMTLEAPQTLLELSSSECLYPLTIPIWSAEQGTQIPRRMSFPSLSE